MFTKKISNVLIALIFLAASNFGQTLSKTGTTAAKFLSVGLGADANAMGGAVSASVSGPSAMYWNVSGIASARRNNALFTYTKMFADINLNYVGVVIPAEDIGVFGFNVTALNYGEMEVTTEDYPDGTGETFTAGSYAFGISYARNITELFSFGINVKYIRETISKSSAEGIAIDIGTMFITPFWDIRFGTSITNFGTKMHMTGDDLLVRYDNDPQTHGNNESMDAYLSTDYFELPLRLQIGLAKNFDFGSDYRITVAADAIYPNDNKPWINVGSEIGLFHNLVLIRVGYKTLFLEDAQEGLTAGFGFFYNKIPYFGIKMDYAYQQLKDLDNIHSFGISLLF